MGLVVGRFSCVEVMRVLQLICFVAGVYGQSDVYWGSYELNIPGGSGSGNAVRDLKLPENAPEFFQFAAFNSLPFAAPQFTPTVNSAPQNAPQNAPRPAPQAVLRTAPQPAPLRVQQQVRPAAPLRVQEQVRPVAPQPQQLRVFQPQPALRQPQRQIPAQRRQPAAPQPSQRVQPVQLNTQSTQRFQNFAPRTVARPAAPVVQPTTVNTEINEIKTEEEVAPVDISSLSRFQLYQLRQKLKKQKEGQIKDDEINAEALADIKEDTQESNAAPAKALPKRTRTGIRRKAVRRKKLVRKDA